MKFRFIRRTVYLIQYLIPATRIAFFSRQGVYSRDGFLLVLGKWRRMFLCLFPPVAKALQKKYGLEGGCQSCGASCKILFQCPHWNTQTKLCNIYEDRPPACRFFPVTPADIRDRNIVLKDEPCGFVFTKAAGKKVAPFKPHSGEKVKKNLDLPRNDIES